jgi:hypothetical protein
MQAALFIDTENLPGFACAAEDLMRRKYGEHKSYAFGSTAVVKSVLARLEAMGVSVFKTATGRNVADHVLKHRLHEVVNSTDAPELIAIASCDGGFAATAAELKARGIRTVCIAPASARLSQRSKTNFDTILYLA